MKRIFFVIFLIISCPRPGLNKVSEPDFLKEALRNYKNNPIYAYNLLNDSVTNMKYMYERSKILTKIYIDQREHERAAALLDSINWSVDLTQYETNIILLKTKRWDMLVERTTDDLLKGIAYYHLNEYTQAIEFLSKPVQPEDYRVIYLAKVYQNLNDFENALEMLITIDTVSTYLYSNYQELLFNIFLNFEDFSMVQKEVKKLKEPHLKEYILLKIYESRKDKKNIKKTAWKLVKKYPESEGAFYSLHLIKPKTKSDRKSLGKVYYYHGDYSNAIKHFKKSTSDNAVNYYMGRIYYSRKNYSESLKYFSRSDWSAAYYYRGRIYENLDIFSKAIAVYDSLYTFYKDSKYAKRGYKRKAFLLEDIGDTLKAVETFLKINEKNTKFRAAMQLFRVGKLNKADTILMSSNEPEFVYWRTRIGERLGKPTESLKDYLLSTYPLSYYTLVRNNEQIVFDATSLEIWVRQLGDSLISFGHDDSLHLKNAIRYFNLNEVDYAIKELGIIEDKSPQDLLYLSKLCAQYGADRQSIIYGLRLKKLAKKNSIEKMPIDLFKLMYPIRYAFSITDQQIELSLCLAMIWQESLFDPEALSPANAKGLMQIIPPTARAIASDLKVQSYSLDDPKVSIRFGCYYFSKLLNDFNSVPLSLAGYNAGPVRAKKWIKQDPNYEIDEFIELIPYNETRNYVKSILNRRIIYKKLLGM